MEPPNREEMEMILAATGSLHATGSHRRELLTQNGGLAVERVRDPLVIDAIVVSIGDRARVMRARDFASWLHEVGRAFEACYRESAT